MTRAKYARSASSEHIGAQPSPSPPPPIPRVLGLLPESQAPAAALLQLALYTPSEFTCPVSHSGAKTSHDDGGLAGGMSVLSVVTPFTPTTSQGNRCCGST